VYSLFQEKANQSSLRDLRLNDGGSRSDVFNEWFFMARQEKHLLAQSHSFQEMIDDLNAFATRERFVYTYIQQIQHLLSPDALQILGDAKQLVRKTFPSRMAVARGDCAQKYHLGAWDAGWYQIKMIRKETCGQFDSDFRAFAASFLRFERRLAPFVYSFGFLPSGPSAFPEQLQVQFQPQMQPEQQQPPQLQQQQLQQQQQRQHAFGMDVSTSPSGDSADVMPPVVSSDAILDDVSVNIFDLPLFGLGTSDINNHIGNNHGGSSSGSHNNNSYVLGEEPNDNISCFDIFGDRRQSESHHHNNISSSSSSSSSNPNNNNGDLFEEHNSNIFSFMNESEDCNTPDKYDSFSNDHDVTHVAKRTKF